MARPEPPETVESSGQDSFLDVVTNIVGILIILVMVTGLRAKRMPVALEVPPSATQSLAEPAAAVASAADQVQQAAQEVAAVDAALADRAQERAALAAAVAAGQQQLEAQRQKLSSEEQHNLQLQLAVNEARAQLVRKQQEFVLYANYEAPATELQNLPTPISRTVMGHEIHFHLKQGCVAYVPLDELLDEVRHVMKNARSMEEVREEHRPVGPLNGFYLRYRMEVGPDNRSIGLRRCRVEPERLPIGEPLQQALADRSAFRRTLASLNPRTDSVTIWFYPDSFNEFRTLRIELHRLGFACAGRPLTSETFIEGGPEGSKSSAE